MALNVSQQRLKTPSKYEPTKYKLKILADSERSARVRVYSVSVFVNEDFLLLKFYPRSLLARAQLIPKETISNINQDSSETLSR